MPANLTDIELSRRLAFMLSETEHAVGIHGGDLPLAARLDNVLIAAMHDPSSVEPERYRALHVLRNTLAGVPA